MHDVIFHPYHSVDKEDASSVCLTGIHGVPAESEVHLDLLKE